MQYVIKEAKRRREGKRHTASSYIYVIVSYNVCSCADATDAYSSEIYNARDVSTQRDSNRRQMAYGSSVLTVFFFIYFILLYIYFFCCLRLSPFIAFSRRMVPLFPESWSVSERVQFSIYSYHFFLSFHFYSSYRPVFIHPNEQHFLSSFVHFFFVLPNPLFCSPLLCISNTQMASSKSFIYWTSSLLTLHASLSSSASMFTHSSFPLSFDRENVMKLCSFFYCKWLQGFTQLIDFIFRNRFGVNNAFTEA